MIYLTTPYSYRLACQITEDTTKIGVMDSPAASTRVPPATQWAADSGCYSQGYPGDVQYLNWLATRPISIRPYALFVTAPDAPCEHAPTLARSRPFFPIIRQLGYPVAFVAQNGANPQNTPWEELDALFIGGTTTWKLGPEARTLTEHALSLHKRVHMGRVNSAARFRYAETIGCTSADGTAAIYDPIHVTDKIVRWISPPTLHICQSPRCGKEFFPTRSDQKTCSDRCRKALSRHHQQQAHQPASAPQFQAPAPPPPRPQHQATAPTPAAQPQPVPPGTATRDQLRAVPAPRTPGALLPRSPLCPQG